MTVDSAITPATTRRTIEPLRRCSQCGFLAYRFSACNTCVVLGVPRPSRVTRLPRDPQAAEHRAALIKAVA